jgi:microcystin-dependent protein
MAEPFIGEVKIVGFNFAPRGWAFCNGQLLPIAQNQALFSLLGTMYGGNGQTTFALPDLRGRVPIHMGNGFTQGQSGGEENHALTINELPIHTHLPQGDSGSANAGTPVGNTWAAQDAAPYASTANVAMNATTIGTAGGSQPHSNLSPYLTLNFCIALVGIFPSRN